MHSPHLTHLWRNFSSGRAPGGRMSFRSDRFRAGVIRKNGAAIAPSAVVRMSFRRERSTVASFSGFALAGNVIAAVGQMAAQVSQ